MDIKKESKKEKDIVYDDVNYDIWNKKIVEATVNLSSVFKKVIEK